MFNLTTRIATLRAGIARHPEHVTFISGTLHMEQVAETLAIHAAALDAAVAHEDATDISSTSTGKEIFDTWKLLQKQVRQLTNLLEWHLERSHGELLPTFTSIPSSRAADIRAQSLLDFVVAHPAVGTDPAVMQEVTDLTTTLTAYRAARAALPEEKASENAADAHLRTAKTAADTYCDCLEMILRRLLRDDTAALADYGLLRKVVERKVETVTPTVA